MSTISSDDYPSFVWTPELYEAVEAIGLRPTDFTVAKLELWWQALRGSRVAPRATLSLRESHPIEDGEGWVLVPREPTEAMLAAFHQGFRQHLGLRHKNRFKLPHELTNKERESAEQAGLRAMLAAAPSNPGTSKVENSRST